jgi:hypothetical protein
MKTKIGVAGEMSYFERRVHSHPKISLVRPFLHKTNGKKGDLPSLKLLCQKIYPWLHS